MDEHPVYDQGIWHSIHARKDCCSNCHGGNCSAAEKDIAHVGIFSNPLEDVYTNCHACHPDDYWRRAEVFAAELRITPASRATPTPVPTNDLANQQSEIEFVLPVKPAPLDSVAWALISAISGLMIAAYSLE
jgi:hypothetical protein